MNLLEIFRSVGSGHLPGQGKSRARVHLDDDDRSPEWNAWRARQALHPRGRIEPVRTAKHTAALSVAERRARRLSTRASRRRAARQQATR